MAAEAERASSLGSLTGCATGTLHVPGASNSFRSDHLVLVNKMLKPLDAEAGANGVDYMRILHTDLVLSVADHLAQPDLVALAGTSRRWRTITRTHQSF